MAQMFDNTHDSKRDTAIPKFYVDHVVTEVIDKETGVPVIEDREMVEIITLGDPGNIPCIPVRDEHRKRWPEHYKAFKEGLEPPVDGTPLEEWPGANKAEIAILHSKGCKTVEALAEASEATFPRRMHDLIFKARAYLQNAEDGKLVEQLRKEIISLKRSNTSLKNKLEEAKTVIKAYELKEDREAS